MIYLHVLFTKRRSIAMKQFWFHLKEITKGESVIRSFQKHRLYQQTIRGEIIDLGSSHKDFYSKDIPQEPGANYKAFHSDDGKVCDFEKDTLPFTDAAYDTVVLLNVLEHIYNHNHLVREIKRIKKPEGTLVGFVPFLIWYHPDHHDYFRYTHEALEKILADAGYQHINVEKLYFGPYTTAFQMIHSTLPKFIRPFIFAPAYGLDCIFRYLRPKGAERFVLGYFFTAV